MVSILLANSISVIVGKGAPPNQTLVETRKSCSLKVTTCSMLTGLGLRYAVEPTEHQELALFVPFIMYSIVFL